MCTDSRLVDEQARIQAENMKSKSKKQDTEMVRNFRIKNGKIEYQNLTSDYWNILCTNIEDLLNITISGNRIENHNIVLANDVRRELDILQNKIDQSYDSDMRMYNLSYRRNSDDSSELYIPTETNFTSDITICEVFDENGVFVADSIKDSGFPLHKIETEQLYIDYIPGNTSDISVYSKKDDMSFKEFYSKNNQSYERDKKELMSHTLGILFIYSTVYLSFIYFGASIAVLSFAIFSVFYFAPIFLPLMCTVLFSLFILTYVEYRIYDNPNKRHEFDIYFN